MVRMMWWLPLVGAVIGCVEDPENNGMSLDVRIDSADETADPDSGNTQMCVNSDAEVFVIWTDNRADVTGTKRDIWFNRSLNRGEPNSWLPSPVKVNVGDVNKPGEGQVFNPKLACNDEGVFVVWEDNRDGILDNNSIYFNRTLDGGDTWLPEDLKLDTMDQGGGSESLLPELVAVGRNIHVVWYDGFNGPYDIYYALSSDAGTTFNSPQTLDISRGSAFSSNPRVEASVDGQNVWVVWEDSREGAQDIYVNRSRNGGITFTGAQRLDRGDDAGATNSFAPQICSDQQQFVYVVWHDERDSSENRDIYYNFTSNAGQDWLALARRLDDGDANGFSNSLFPNCAVDGATAHVVWQDYRTFNAFDIWYRTITNGQATEAEERVDLGEPNFAQQEGFANSRNADVAIADNRVGVAWLDFRQEALTGADRDFGDLRYNFKDIGQTFQETDLRLDSWDAGGSFKSDINFQMLGGELYAAWTDGREGTFDIYFSRLVIGEEGIAPIRE